MRILKRPQTARALLIGFDEVEAAGACVAAIIASGITPAGMEMMDKPAIHAAEAFVGVGYPLDVEALADRRARRAGRRSGLLCIERVRADAGAQRRARHPRLASERERLAFWAGRKAAFPAVGRLSPDYYCMDGTIPRRELPRVLRAMVEMQARYGLRVANVFHAGDGNLHPLILDDANVPGELDKAEAFGFEILEALRRRRRRADGRARRRSREARSHDVPVRCRRSRNPASSEARIRPEVRFNPGKVFPTLRRCAEQGREHVHVRRGTLRASAAGSDAMASAVEARGSRHATRQTSPRSSPARRARSSRSAAARSGRSASR